MTCPTFSTGDWAIGTVAPATLALIVNVPDEYPKVFQVKVIFSLWPGARVTVLKVTVKLLASMESVNLSDIVPSFRTSTVIVIVSPTLPVIEDTLAERILMLPLSTLNTICVEFEAPKSSVTVSVTV